MMMKDEYDVFISYTHCDIEWVKKLVNALTEANLNVWWDKGKIRPGDSLIQSIEAGIKASKNIVFVISPGSIKSGWVRREYESAMILSIQSNQHYRLIPVLLGDAELPGFLLGYKWVDFRVEADFERGIQELIWGIVGEKLQITSPISSKSPFSVDEIMARTKKSLIISGHTLDKFSSNKNKKIKKTLADLLLDRQVEVTLVLLNPFSNYAKAHEPFHRLESDSSAHKQILDSLDFFLGLYKTFGNPHNFQVLLSSYMPRFRTIIIDDEECYISLYMYGKDVVATPQLRLEKNASDITAEWFRSVHDSTRQLITSPHVLPFIRDGNISEDWPNSKAAFILHNCLETSCCKDRSQCWAVLKKVILGYQNEDPQLPYKFNLCNPDYRPGTFTLDSIKINANFFLPTVSFDEWIGGVLEEELETIKNAYPDLFKYRKKDDIKRTVVNVLNLRPLDATPIKAEI